MKRFTLFLMSFLTLATLTTMGNTGSKRTDGEPDFYETKKKIEEMLKFSAMVELAISAEDDLKDRVYSYISRELRSLGDVQVVKGDSDWVISIVAARVTRQSGLDAGFVLSAVGVNRFHLPTRSTLNTVFKVNNSELSEHAYASLRSLTDGLGECRYHQILIGPTGDLMSLCQNIVTDFDAGVLKEERERSQSRIKDILDALKSSKEQAGTKKPKSKQDK